MTGWKIFTNIAARSSILGGEGAARGADVPQCCPDNFRLNKTARNGANVTGQSVLRLKV